MWLALSYRVSSVLLVLASPTFVIVVFSRVLKVRLSCGLWWLQQLNVLSRVESRS